ncbi:MAG: hypothetical protein L0Y36_05735 [Planctomycetales bacterium]|nr:hypothetical protein [Planctomycetales bacterium]
MELIKQIKDAEKQAKDIVDKARQDAALLVEESKKQRTNILREAQRRRLEAIEKAVADAQAAGKTQVEELNRQGGQDILALKAACSSKIQPCIDTIVSRLQQTS